MNKFTLTLLLLSFILTKSSSTFQKVDDFLKIRCDMSGKNVFYTWTGTIFNYMPQQEPELLFNFVGYNVARCVKSSQGNWQLLTREISYYLDPNTNEKLSTWKNPYTGETLNVIPVSNDPVNSPLFTVPYEKITEETGVVVSDFPLFYPNPLHGNDTFLEYSGADQFYEAGEFFKFYFNIQQLENAKDQLEKVSIAWNKNGPYLPWMKMGSIKGQLVYSVYGTKAQNIESLPQWLQDDVHNRLPHYLEAPTTYERPNETAFTYFKKHFDEYLRGDQFPLPIRSHKKEIKFLEN
jgi:hypothetical protein